jgi:GT2 family glycosyltransferase
VDALNLGFDHAKGEIILLLDDDAIPFPDLVQAHVQAYQLPNIGGVAGDIFATPLNEAIKEFKPKLSALVSESRVSRMAKLGLKVWNRPLQGQEDFLFYISRAGAVSLNPNVAKQAHQTKVKSLLGRGANMSMCSAAIGDFRFPNSWVFGFTFEQYLAWHIWKKGYMLTFEPKAMAYHIEHGQSLSRNFAQTNRETLLFTEQKLLFYRLYGKEPNLSVMQRIAWLAFETLLDIKRICLNREVHRISGLKSTVYSMIFGVKLVLQRKTCHADSVLRDLERLRK